MDSTRPRVVKQMDFFINNTCNLTCRHCYVSPEMDRLSLMPTEEIKRVLGEAIDLGVRTIGCTGKEPLATMDRTEDVLKFLRGRKMNGANIKYGIVTNGVLLDDERARRLDDLRLDYLDISLDGTERVHDQIRGAGSYERTVRNVRRVLEMGHPHLEKTNIFVAFTMNPLNAGVIPELIREMQQAGLGKVFISPHQSKEQGDPLVLSPREHAGIVRYVMANSNAFSGMDVFFKNGRLSGENIQALEREGIVDFDRLYRDEIGVVYSVLERGGNRIFFNMPSPEPLTVIRMNSNGDLTTCLNMFKDREYGSVGSVTERPLGELLRRIGD